MTTNIFTINPYDKKMTLDQINGIPIKLALLDHKGNQLHPPVMCKDYIQDAFWSEHLKKKTDVYGFKWNPGTLDLTKPNFLMHVHFDNLSDATAITNIIALLNQWDSQFDFKTTKLYKSSEQDFVLDLNMNWAQAPIRLSILTHLIRVGSAYQPPETYPEFLAALLACINLSTYRPIKDAPRKLLAHADWSHLVVGKARLLKIWNDKKFPQQTYQQYAGDYDVHSSSGLLYYKETT